MSLIIEIQVDGYAYGIYETRLATSITLESLNNIINARFSYHKKAWTEY